MDPTTPANLFEGLDKNYHGFCRFLQNKYCDIIGLRDIIRGNPFVQICLGMLFFSENKPVYIDIIFTIEIVLSWAIDYACIHVNLRLCLLTTILSFVKFQNI